MPPYLTPPSNSENKLIVGKFYLYGSNPDQYFLVNKFLGFDSLGRILMKTSAGPAQIIGENLTFIGPFNSQQEGINSGYKMYPNASKHYAEPQIYYEANYSPYQYQYYPFYTYFYPYWRFIPRRFGPWRPWHPGWIKK